MAQSTFAFIIAMVFWYFLLNWVRRDRFDRIAEIYLTQGHCAACGYKLEGLTAESDGCILCPECNAAWKQDRIGTQPQS